jgi:hypothetical protein
MNAVTRAGRIFLSASVALAVLCSTAGAAGIEASTPDGRWRLVAQQGVLLVHEGRNVLPIKELRIARADGTEPSVASALLYNAARNSFLAAFESLPELWEIPLDPTAEPIASGLVHDYRLREGAFEPAFLGIKRTALTYPVLDFAVSSSGAYVAGRASGKHGKDILILAQLDVRRQILAVPIDLPFRMGDAVALRHGGAQWMRFPAVQGAKPWCIDFSRARAPVECP